MNRTLLTSYGIPHLDVVLDEIFAIPAQGVFGAPLPPTTVEELAERCGLAHELVAETLTRIATMSEHIEIQPEALAVRLPASTGLILLDVREPWEFEIAHLPGSILLATVDFAAVLPQLQAAECVVTICHHGIRSYSAAMWLRQRGVGSAVSLAGGLAAWAERIDPSMEQY